ncbi:MAG: Putative short-chain dehydrogenase, partial [uncultured Acetobacteraceae bacterium]
DGPGLRRVRLRRAQRRRSPPAAGPRRRVGRPHSLARSGAPGLRGPPGCAESGRSRHHGRRRGRSRAAARLGRRGARRRPDRRSGARGGGAGRHLARQPPGAGGGPALREGGRRAARAELEFGRRLRDRRGARRRAGRGRAGGAGDALRHHETRVGAGRGEARHPLGLGRAERPAVRGLRPLGARHRGARHAEPAVPDPAGRGARRGGGAAARGPARLDLRAGRSGRGGAAAGRPRPAPRALQRDRARRLAGARLGAGVAGRPARLRLPPGRSRRGAHRVAARRRRPPQPRRHAHGGGVRLAGGARDGGLGRAPRRVVAGARARPDGGRM